MSPRPAWLKFDAHRRCRARACSVRACRPVGFAADEGNGSGFHRSACQRFLRAVRRLPASRLPATRPTAEQIRADLKAIAPYTRAIRTYSSTGGAELVPPIAAEFGLKVTVGAWIDKNKERNEREIRSALELARHNSNVNAIVVGNETMLRAEMTADDLIKLIQRVKRSSPVPVTTGEIWIGLDRPSGARLGGRFHRRAYPALLGRLRRRQGGRPHHRVLRPAAPAAPRQAHRDRRIRLAERRLQFPRRQSRPHRAGRRHPRFRQPRRGLWHRLQHRRGDRSAVEDRGRRRRSLLGTVRRLAAGQILLDRPDHRPRLHQARRPRRPARAPAVAADPGHRRGDRHAGADARGVAPIWSAPGARPSSRSGRATISCPARPLRSGSAWCCSCRSSPSRWRGIEEIAAIAFGRPPRRLANSPPLVPEGLRAESVDPHSGLSRAAGDAQGDARCRGARSTIRISNAWWCINNTPDPALWRPVEEHCRTLGERFKFVRVDKLDGYKAGALRLALDAHRAGRRNHRHASMPTTWSNPDWLKDLVPLFADPRVGFVQSPQDHRDGDRSLMHRAMNAEYAGFFDIGMVQRNEVNAIVMHGTMCLIRRAAHRRRRRLVERHHRRGHRSRPVASSSTAGSRITPTAATATGCCPTRSTPTSASASAGPMAASSWCASTGGSMLPWSDDALPRTEARIRPRLAQLARRRQRRRGRRAAQYPLGAGGRLRQYRGAGPHSDLADHRRLRGLGRPFRHALSAAGARLGGRCSARSAPPCRCNGPWRAPSASGLLKERLPFLRTAKGGATRKGDFPAFWEAMIAGASVARRADAGGDQLQAGPRDQYFRAGPGGAEPAVPGGGRDRGDRRHALQHFRLLARARGHGAMELAAAARRSSPKRRSCLPRTASKRRSKRGFAIDIRPARFPRAAPNTTSRAGSPRR